MASAPLFPLGSPSSQETISHKPQLREAWSSELPFQPSRPGGAASSTILPTDHSTGSRHKRASPCVFLRSFLLSLNQWRISHKLKEKMPAFVSPYNQVCPHGSAAPGPWVLTVSLVLFMLLPGFRTQYICQGSCVLCICFLETCLGYHLHCRCVAPLHSASVPIKSY